MSSFKARLGLLLFLLLAVILSRLWLGNASHKPSAEVEDQSPTVFSATKSSLQGREEQADKTYWAKEMLAQECGRTFESFWDLINVTTNKLELLARFPLDEIAVPNWDSGQDLPHGIKLYDGRTAGRKLSSAEWRSLVEGFARDGWNLDNIEFRHNRFDPDEQGNPSKSHFYFAARLTNSQKNQRAVLEGDLPVYWAPKGTNDEFQPVQRIDASHLALKTRTGEPPFQPILQETIVTGDKLASIDPLIVYDLDGDGFSEIILAGQNLLYRRNGPDHYERQTLCRHPIQLLKSAVIADFDGDGRADLLCANSQGLFLFKGSSPGTFDDPPLQVWKADPPLRNAMALTCGDIDRDGDLDIFLGQYKVPTLGQILRPNYYDATDSWPSYLLVNDGQGNFTDATEAAGLAAKRGRRVYSASLADLNNDGHPDLVTASDFAGLDVYRNDGQGHFTEVTREWVGEWHGFGMGLALADFNADGRLDLLMIGMPSTTVDRLEHLGLSRPYSADDRGMRSAMTFGNRLLLARSEGGFEQTAMSDSIARSGWSWGGSAFDFDNDGFPDVYIANGLESTQTVREYEPEFWLHDMFVGDEVDDVTASKYFIEKFSRTRGRGWSYGGYEKNRLFLNRAGKSFVEIGHLAGVALEQDCRNVVADDLDGDGRVDLVVTSLEVWPEVKQTMKVFKNSLQDGGHWIGFRFRDEGNGKSPVGARVTIQYGGRNVVREIVNGDSHRSQHANTVHFGVGESSRVESAEIRWTNGKVTSLRDLAVDRYHDISSTR
ncbi:MAG TPA: CRTAC1 family protein [Candidatus Limnocylindrales bacterium]|nr:CRTAC1 family protein [Candidatus Limnocylindrales bacterium]